MRVIALTGGIAMGKSTAAAVFRRAHVPVFDADAVVHALQAPGGPAIAAIGQAFPATIRGRTLDRPALRAAVLADPAALRRLESIIHPMVATERRRFLARQRRAGAALVVLDIPLLLESQVPRGIDLIAVVTAPPAIQRHRIRIGRHLTPAQADAIIARQMPDAHKRRHADVLIHTGLSRHHAQRQVRRLIRSNR